MPCLFIVIPILAFLAQLTLLCSWPTICYFLKVVSSYSTFDYTMALEGLGAAAAIVQFVQLGPVLLKLYDKLKDGPKDIEWKARSLQDFGKLCQMGRDFCHTPGTSQAIDNMPRDELDLLLRLLDKADKEVKDLDQLLAKISSGSQNRARSLWKAIKALCREGDISERLGRINEIREDISSIYSPRTLRLVSRQGYLSHQIETRSYS